MTAPPIPQQGLDIVNRSEAGPTKVLGFNEKSQFKWVDKGSVGIHAFIGSQHSGAEYPATARASITSDSNNANHVFHGNGAMGKVSNTDMTSQGVTEPDKVLTSDGNGNVVWTSKSGSSGNYAMNEKEKIDAVASNPGTPSGIYDVAGGLGVPGALWNHLFVSKHRDDYNDGGRYGAQIAIPLLGGGDEMYFRRSEDSATYGNWHRVLKDTVGTNEINDAAVTAEKIKASELANGRVLSWDQGANSLKWVDKAAGVGNVTQADSNASAPYKLAMWQDITGKTLGNNAPVVFSPGHTGGQWGGMPGAASDGDQATTSSPPPPPAMRGSSKRENCTLKHSTCTKMLLILLR